MPEKWDFLGQLVHYVLGKKLKTSKKQEIWYVVGGKPIRLSLKEFVFIFRLKTGPLPSWSDLERVTKDACLKDELFRVGARVTVDKLRSKFVNMDSEPRSRKKVRVAFVYLLAGFLMAQDPSKSIYPYYFQMVMDLELFHRFPWGNVCFELIADYLSIDLNAKYDERQKKKKTAPKKNNFYGCAQKF